MRRLARLLCTAILLVSIPAISNAQQPATWRLVEEWRVGGEPDGPHSFDALFGFARLPNGNLVHFDYKTEQLHFLDAKGTPLKTVGRKGSGPGETRLANGFAVMPNGRIVMNDRGNSRFVIRDVDGRPLSVHTVGNRSSMGSQWNGQFLNDGRLLEVVGMVPAVPDREEATVMWAKGFTRADTVNNTCAPNGTKGVPGTFPLRNPAGRLLMHFEIPFSRPATRQVFDAAGFVWQPLDLTSNEIVKRKVGTCEIVASVKLPGTRAVLAAEDRAQSRTYVAARIQELKGVAPDISAWPTHHGWFRTMHVDAQRNLWVQRDVGNKRPSLDVYSTNGKHIATVTTGSPSMMPGRTVITDDYMYGFVPDVDNIFYLVAYRILKQ